MSQVLQYFDMSYFVEFISHDQSDLSHKTYQL